MRHRGSWDKDENKSFKNGPLVCPGKYKAVLSLGEKVNDRIYHKQGSKIICFKSGS